MDAVTHKYLLKNNPAYGEAVFKKQQARMNKMPDDKHFTFEEAIELLRANITGFTFVNSNGQILKATLNATQNIVLEVQE